jgi:hypothetical protein
MAKTASTSTTESTAGIASSTRAVRAAGVASYRSASARTGSESARRSAAKPGPRSRKAQDAALGAGCGRPDRIGLHGRQGSGRLARRGPSGPYREDGRGQRGRAASRARGHRDHRAAGPERPRRADRIVLFRPQDSAQHLPAAGAVADRAASWLGPSRTRPSWLAGCADQAHFSRCYGITLGAYRGAASG